MPVCHAGQLLKLGCHVEEGSKRVCSACLAAHAEGLQVPSTRCRLLPQPLGTFHGARSFYVAWSNGVSTIDGVRPLKIMLNDAHGNPIESAQLLIFTDEATAIECEQALPSGQLLRIAEESATLRMCAGSKSFCPAGNFDSPRSKTCRVHLAWVAGGKRPRANSCSSCNATASAVEAETAAPAPQSPALTVDDMLFSALCDDDSSTDTRSSPSSIPSHEASPPRLPGGQACDTVLPCAISVESLDVGGRLLAQGETLKAGGSSQWTVRSQLFAPPPPGGLRPPARAAHRCAAPVAQVVSDARLKDVVATFDLGVGEVHRLRPKVFKYKAGLRVGGADPDRLYVGLIAQEVPEALAAYCRRKVTLRLRAEDEEDTEIFMLDHSVLPFVCINALQDLDSKLAAASQRIDTLERTANVVVEQAAAVARHQVDVVSRLAIRAQPITADRGKDAHGRQQVVAQMGDAAAAEETARSAGGGGATWRRGNKAAAHRAALRAASQQLRAMKHGVKLALLGVVAACVVAQFTQYKPNRPTVISALGTGATIAAYACGGWRVAAPCFVVGLILLPTLMGFYAIALSDRSIDFLFEQIEVPRGSSRLRPPLRAAPPTPLAAET